MLNIRKLITTALWPYLFFYLPSIAQHIGSPVGFANVPAYGVTKITGGMGGEVISINGQADAQKLQNALGDDTPRIIYINGSIQLPQYPSGTTVPVSDVTMRMTLVRSNKTILGIGHDAKIVQSGLSIYSGNGEDNPQDTAVHNIIIQNITFEAAPDDAINIQGGSHHIWVDHCTFTDGSEGPLGDDAADGQLDFKRGSDYLTVSYCLFTNHKKMSLVGHSNSAGDIDRGFLRATYDHNFFNDLSGSASSRHPRVRFGIVHVLNCFIQGVGKDSNTEGVVSQCEAKVFVEGCHFRFAKWGGSVNEHSSQSETDGLLEEKNNTNDQCAKDFTFVTGERFSPSDYFNYEYTPENPSDIAAKLPNKVGAGILNIQKVPVVHTYNAPRVSFHSISLDTRGEFVYVTTGQTANSITAFAIMDLSGRMIQHCLRCRTHTNGYYVSIHGLPSGTYLLTTSHHTIIGTFNRP